MKLFSLVYRPDIDTYYLYDSSGRRILTDYYHKNKKRFLASEDRYGFSFRDDFNGDKAVAWAQLLEDVELEEGMEYFRQAEMGSLNMRDIILGMMTYWLDRARVEGAPMPGLVQWSRDGMVDPKRHEKKISKFYTGTEAVAAVETIFSRYVELVKTREFQNYGNFWPNEDRIMLLTLRVGGMKFIAISRKMGRTAAACRAQYGRIRRGEDTIFVELSDWDILREALPLGVFRELEILPDYKSMLIDGVKIVDELVSILRFSGNDDLNAVDNALCYLSKMAKRLEGITLTKANAEKIKEIGEVGSVEQNSVCEDDHN